MSAGGESGGSRRGEPRVPLGGRVRLRYEFFQKFLEENAANISAGGMFIHTDHPGEPGTELDFEIRLGDDLPLIEGRGEVVWVRRGGQEPGREPGMGVRFVELLGDSRALVDRIVRERVAEGLELFDLEAQVPAPEAPAVDRAAVVTPPGSDDEPIWQLDAGSKAAGDAAVGEASPTENLAALDPEMPAATAPPVPFQTAATAARRPDPATGRASPLRLLAVAAVSALIGAGAVLVFYWLYVQPSIDSLETRIDELAGSPGGPWVPPADEPEPLAAASGEAAIDGVARPAVSPAGQSSEIVDALRSWAAAWSGQRVEDYLAHYAADFAPPDGLDRAAWEAARRARIERPRWIRVALTLVQVEPAGPDAAEVRFVQSYRSERFKDLVRKSLRMVREDGAWKIAAERTEP